jgi:hypothetical protein
MEELEIIVTENLDGVVFSLPVAARLMIKQQFPDAHPVSRIFVAYDTKSDFESHLEKLEKHIFPALIGLDADKGLKGINKIVFVNADTNKKYLLTKARA